MSDAFKDSFKQFANKKQGILNKLIDSHEERLLGTLKKLEDDIIAELTKATSGGVNLTTQIAIQLRPNLKTLIEQNFLKEADTIVSEYDEIVMEKYLDSGKLSEDEIIKGEGTGYQTASEIEKEISELTEDGSPYWQKTHPNHAKTVERVFKLREQLNG